MILSMSFLVKFREASYVHCQWMPGSAIIDKGDDKTIVDLVNFVQLTLLREQEKVVSFATPRMRSSPRSIQQSWDRPMPSQTQ